MLNNTVGPGKNIEYVLFRVLIDTSDFLSGNPIAGGKLSIG